MRFIAWHSYRFVLKRNNQFTRNSSMDLYFQHTAHNQGLLSF